MPYKKLIDGFRVFQADYLTANNKDEFQKLVLEGQKPTTLVIACSDSRIDPAIITNSKPGDFFAVRNVAALVPPYDNSDSLHGTSSAIEYAVRFLQVKHIVILGHANCGGIQALATNNYAIDTDSSFHFIEQWLNIAKDAKELVSKQFATYDQTTQTRILERAAILVSLHNLLTFPWIADKCQANELNIHGWFFDINASELLEYDCESASFIDVLKHEITPLTTHPDMTAFLSNCDCHNLAQ